MGVRMPTFQPIRVPDGTDPAVADLISGLNARISEYGAQVQQAVRDVIDRKHAPIMIPATTIDASQGVLSVTAASVSGMFTNLVFQNTASTTSASLQTAVDYTGRGILTRLMICEKTSGGTTAYNATLKITLDGNVIYNDTTALTRQSQFRAIHGTLQVISSTILGMVDGRGLPFNKELKIEYASDGTKTTTVGWHIDKVL